MLEKEKDGVYSFRPTRKAYLVEYGCGLSLLIILLILKLNGFELTTLIRNIVIVIALICVLSAEFARIFIRYKVTPSRLEIIYGLIKQRRKHVYFHPLAIPDINLHQTRIQRILNYGTIGVMGQGENLFEIKGIDKPKKIIRIMENFLEDNRTKPI